MDESKKCAVCASRNSGVGVAVAAVAVVVETGEGVCQGHIVPTLLAGYGVERLRKADDASQV